MYWSFRYRIDELTLDTGRCQVLRGTEVIAVSKLSYRLLCALVEGAPNVLTHEELARKAWGPQRIVTPENLTQRVMILRRALGDRADRPRYIEGIRGIGYRLIPEIRIEREVTTPYVDRLAANGTQRENRSAPRERAAPSQVTRAR
jgi:DNA-binding winged helix-turn-helix (wHTH) protein